MPTKIFKKSDGILRKISDSHSVMNYLTSEDCDRFSVAVGKGDNHEETTSSPSDRAYYVIEGEITIDNKLIGHPGDVLYIPANTEYTFKGTFKVVVINSPPFKKPVK